MEQKNTPFQKGPVELSHIGQEPTRPRPDFGKKQSISGPKDSLTAFILKSGIVKNETYLRYAVVIFVAIIFVAIFLLLFYADGGNLPSPPPGYDI